MKQMYEARTQLELKQLLIQFINVMQSLHQQLDDIENILQSQLTSNK
jgi:hypothetical protein